MNKYLSIIELRIRQSLPKVLAVLAVMAAAQLIWFKVQLGRYEDYSLAEAGRFFCIVNGIALVVICLLLGGRREKGTHSSYRLRTLGVKGRTIYVAEMISDLLMFAVAWGVQTLVMAAAVKMYTSAPGYSLGPLGPVVQITNTVGLAALLPLENKSFWLAGAFCYAALSLAATYMKTVHRDGDFPILSSAVIVFYGLWHLLLKDVGTAPTHFGEYLPVMAMMALALCSVVFGINRCSKERKEADDGE